jgi:N-acetylmuramoyl-L-alanine amidase
MTFDKYRTDWVDPKVPVTGPVFNTNAVTHVAIHYTAAPTVSRNTAQYLRSINSDYTSNRGYSIGYNAAVDQDGVTWELRGFDFRCAANKEANNYTFAILCLVDGANPANEKMIEGVKRIVNLVKVRCKDSIIVGHRDLGSTACPGAGLYNQIKNGVFNPLNIDVEGPTMIQIDYAPGTPQWVACVYTGTQLAWVRNGHAAKVLQDAKVPKVSVNRDGFLGLIQSSQTTTDAPPMDSILTSAWNKNRG